MKAYAMTAIACLPLLILIVLLYSGCPTVEAAHEEQPEAAPAPVEEPRMATAEEKEEEAELQATEAKDEPEEEITPDTSYEMGEEEYKATKKDLSELVQELNDIISQKNYGKWLKYLTFDYIDYYSDPEVLKKYSESPTMKKYNIKLRSLKDYFNYVVVASRRDVRIDDIHGISESEVKAYMIINDEPIVVYTLEKVDDRWKITR